MSNIGHLDNVDFIKGIATMSVLLLHTFPRFVLNDTLAVFHIWQAVPLFLFVSFYLGFRNLEKKEDVFIEYYSKDRLKKIFLKIWLPLLILAIIESVFFLVFGKKERAIGSLLCYDNGPGSYYVWCYMQIWLLIPVIYLLIKRSGIAVGGGILLILGVLLDFLWERYIGLNPGYTCFRYLFLGVPAYMYLNGFNIKKTTPLFLLSIIYLALMKYSKVPQIAEPFLPNGWECQTGIAFFYALLLFVALSYVYKKIKCIKVRWYITHLGSISWEVFCIQMVLLGSGIPDLLSSRFFHVAYMRVGFKVIATLIITLLLAELYKKAISIVLHVNKHV